MSRGCGTRAQRGIYLVQHLGPDGLPLEAFMVDPTAESDLRALGITSIGVQLIDHGGTHSVFDMVGSSHYPNVADFLEEARRHGVSRRLPKNLPFEQITPASRLVLLHQRAVILDRDRLAGPGWPPVLCCQDILAMWLAEHGRSLHGYQPPHWPHDAHDMCSRYWYLDVAGTHVADGRLKRQIGDTTYPVPALRPDGEGRYLPGPFAVFCPTGIEVIRADDGSHEALVEQLVQRANLPVEVCDE